MGHMGNPGTQEWYISWNHSRSKYTFPITFSKLPFKQKFSKCAKAKSRIRHQKLRTSLLHIPEFPAVPPRKFEQCCKARKSCHYHDSSGSLRRCHISYSFFVADLFVHPLNLVYTFICILYNYIIIYHISYISYIIYVVFRKVLQSQSNWSKGYPRMGISAFPEPRNWQSVAVDALPVQDPSHSTWHNKNQAPPVTHFFASFPKDMTEKNPAIF